MTKKEILELVKDKTPVRVGNSLHIEEEEYHIDDMVINLYYATDAEMDEDCLIEVDGKTIET